MKRFFIFLTLSFWASFNLPYCANNQQCKVFLVNGVRFKMIYVKGGTLTFGDCNDKGMRGESNVPATTKLHSFYISETEVTQELWTAVMGSYYFSIYKDKEFPASNISWFHCKKFVEELSLITGQNFRLPTEAEWEYAANGGQETNSYDFSGSDSLDEVGWYKANSNRTIQRVKGKKPNSLGLYDMSGNVMEWCEDKYDATGLCRVIRGGDYNSLSSFCFTIWNMHCEDWEAHTDLGFRIVLTDLKPNIPTKPMIQKYDQLYKYNEQCSWNAFIRTKINDKATAYNEKSQSPWRDIGFNEYGCAYVVNKSGKVGFINKDGGIITPCIWKEANIFQEDLSPVVNEQGLYGFINREGNIVVECKWKWAGLFENGMATVMDEKGRNGCIDKSGEIIVPCQYSYNSDYRYLHFENGMAAYQDKKGKYGCIDINGNNVISCQWDDLELYGCYIYMMNSHGEWGCMDRQGRVIIPCKWKHIGCFFNGYALVEDSNGMYGHINRRGESLSSSKWKYASSFRFGMAYVKDNSNLYGYINTNGELAIPCRWKSCSDFSEGLAMVEDLNGKYGFIDRNGSLIIPCIYYFGTSSFFNGLAVVCDKKGKKGYIDKVGNVVIPCVWEEADGFNSNGWATVYDEKEQAFIINEAGLIVLPRQNDEN